MSWLKPKQKQAVKTIAAFIKADAMMGVQAKYLHDYISSRRPRSHTLELCWYLLGRINQSIKVDISTKSIVVSDKSFMLKFLRMSFLPTHIVLCSGVVVHQLNSTYRSVSYIDPLYTKEWLIETSKLKSFQDGMCLMRDNTTIMFGDHDEQGA